MIVSYADCMFCIDTKCCIVKCNLCKNCWVYFVLDDNDGIVCVRRLLYPPLCLGIRSQMGPGKPLWNERGRKLFLPVNIIAKIIITNRIEGETMCGGTQIYQAKHPGNKVSISIWEISIFSFHILNTVQWMKEGGSFFYPML